MRGIVLTSASALALGACAAPAEQPVSLLEYEAVAPSAWDVRPPENSMRLTEFDAGDGAEVVVFYFGPGQGGSAEANVARWESQFAGPEGAPVSADVSTLDGAAFPTTVAELGGAYSRTVGMGMASGDAEPDQALVAAVVETPQGNLFPQLFGPREAVAAERDAFLRFLRSIGPADAR